MNRTFLFVAMAFLAGSAFGFFARNAGIGTLRRGHTHAADLAAIKKLEQEDIEVTLSQDPKGLVDVLRMGCALSPEASPPLASKRSQPKMRSSTPSTRSSRC
jgi:hypothetical protein